MKTITGKHILSALLTLAAMLPGQKAAADTPITHGGQNYTLFDSEGFYTATAGSATPSTYTYEYLVDNVIVPQWAQQPFLYTYWMTDDDYGFTTKFVEFHSAAPIVFKGYRLRTAINTKDHPNRRPKSWTLMGKKHADDADWTVLATVSGDTPLPVDNEKTADYWQTGNTLPFQYFRFEVTAIQGPEEIQIAQNISYKRWRMELSELQIIGNSYSADHDLDYATIEGLQHYYPHTGSVISPDFTVKDMGGHTLTKDTHYTVSYSPATPNATGNYTLTVTGKDSYFGRKTASFKVVNTLAGKGTETEPYIIADANDWYVFGKYIRENVDHMADKYYKLADTFDNSNEPITEMIATTKEDPNDGKTIHSPFYGTLDGNGRTLHIDLKADSDDGCAPFRYLEGATIKNLTVAGSVATSSKYGASIAVNNLNPVGYINGTEIIDCYSSVTITSSINGDGTNGGFVAVNKTGGRLAFTRCAFLGRMLGSTADSNGGFVGWNEEQADITFTQCLFDPIRITMNPYNSKTFNRGKAPIFQAPASYFTYADWGTDQGSRIVQLTARAASVSGENKFVTSFFNGSQDFRLPAGALAYTVKNDGSNLAFYRIGPESNVIPKGTAVVIIADKTSDEALSLIRLYSTTTDIKVDAGKNDLKGSDVDMDNTSGNKYVLGISEGTLGFYKYSGSSIPAGKAYLLNQ